MIGAKIGAVGLLVAGAAFMIPACAQNTSSLVIRGVLAPSLDTCAVLANPSSTQLSTGTMDLAITEQYSASLLLENQVVARGDANKLRTETSAVVLYEADVQIQDVTGATLARSDGSSAEYSIPMAGFIDQATSGTPGYGYTTVLLVDAATAADLKVATKKDPLDIVVNVSVRGRTLGGDELQSAPFAFPIHACVGCLVTCPAKADNPDIPGRDCESTAEDAKPNCRLGLDFEVDCRLCRGNAACSCK